MIANKTARAILYNWHSGQGSPFYAAASSGMVVSFALLASECAAIDEPDRARLMAWIQHQQQRAPRVQIANFQCQFYYALPWCKPVVVRLKPMRREVGSPRNGKPGYKWASGYAVNGEYPPIDRNAAYARAREIGGPNVKVIIEE